MTTQELKDKIYGSVACYNADPFICEEDEIIEQVAQTIQEYGLQPAEDFANAVVKLDLAHADKFEVYQVFETPNGELTICFNEDYAYIESAEVEDVELMKGNYNTGDTLTWTYNGKEYSCTGEFYVDKDNVLHHTFYAPNGKEIEITTPYE